MEMVMLMCLACGVFSAFMSSRLNRNVYRDFVIGFLLGPVGIAYLFLNDDM